MSDAASVISGVFKVISAIYAQVQLVKANQEQCNRLSERVRIIEQGVRGLEKIQDQKQYERGLRELNNALKSCLQYMNKLSAADWFAAFFKAGTYKDEFLGLNNELQQAVQQLGLGLVAQQIVNREQDRVDQQADIAFVKANHAQIIGLVQTGNAAVGRLDLHQRENQAIMLKQFESMKKLIMGLDRPAERPPIDPHYMVPYFELIFDQKLGAGSFGQIYLGSWRGQVAVIKSIEGAVSAADQEQFVREVQIMSQCRDRHITQFYGASLESEGRSCLLMEYMEKGSLYQVLERPIALELQKQMALEIARGLKYLHSREILHRDLKSANVLVNVDNHAKLSDFGLSHTKAISVKTAGQKSEATRWLAPECFTRGGVYTAQADIYSYGVILWELVTGRRPYAGVSDEKIPALVLRGARDSLDGIPETYASLIRGCWELKATNRPNLDYIIQTLDSYELRPASPTPDEYYQRGVHFDEARDYPHALDAYTKAIGKGHVKARTNMGLFFLLGKGGTPDKPRAAQLFLEAAQQGHPRAMTNIGIMLKLGDGVTQNLPEALTWFKAAAQHGDTQAAHEAQQLEEVLRPPAQYSLTTRM